MLSETHRLDVEKKEERRMKKEKIKKEHNYNASISHYSLGLRENCIGVRIAYSISHHRESISQHMGSVSKNIESIY